MTCKDCIHFESCKKLYETHGEGLSGDSFVCDSFKDQSRQSAITGISHRGILKK